MERVIKIFFVAVFYKAHPECRRFPALFLTAGKIGQNLRSPKHDFQQPILDKV